MATEVRAEEPELSVYTGPPGFFRSKRFLRLFLPPSVVAVLGAIALLVSGNLALPFQPVVTLTGKVGSEKVAFFQDDEVRRILMANHIQVDVVGSGSRDIATHDVDSFDFVFPAGRPAAATIEDARQQNKGYLRTYRPFISPLVLATYRPYAEALVRAGVATAEPAASGQLPYYYDLDMDGFVGLLGNGKSWNAIGIEGTRNGNHVLAQTSNVCSSNAAATYLALVAFVANNHTPVSQQDQARDLAAKIKPLLVAQGLPDAATADRFTLYLTPEGSGHAPIIVVYEHQYLAYQVQRAQAGGADPSRVLLYPKDHFLAQPELIALTPGGDRLGRLLTTDPGLQRRAMELGLRVLDQDHGDSSANLPQFLRTVGVPAPPPSSDDTTAFLPDLPLLETLITIVGDCPS